MCTYVPLIPSLLSKQTLINSVANALNFHPYGASLVYQVLLSVPSVNLIVSLYVGMCGSNLVFITSLSNIHTLLFLLPLPSAGVRLTVDAVFELLKKTNKDWNWLADQILWVSPSKRHEIAQRCSTADDCLMESVQFWMKRHPHASYRWIAFCLYSWSIGGTLQEMQHLLEPMLGKNKCMHGRYY